MTLSARRRTSIYMTSFKSRWMSDQRSKDSVIDAASLRRALMWSRSLPSAFEELYLPIWRIVS